MKKLGFRHSNVINFALVSEWLTGGGTNRLVNNGNTPAFLGALWLYCLIRKYMITRDMAMIIRIKEKLHRDQITYYTFPAYCGAYAHKINMHKGYAERQVETTGRYWAMIVKVLNCITSDNPYLWHQMIERIEILEARRLKTRGIDTRNYDREIAWNKHSSYTTLFSKPKVMQNRQ